MSRKYREEFGSLLLKRQEMRTFCQRPGTTDENGEIQYFTEQNHKKECDVNEIIKKYDKTGIITHIAKIEGYYGDLSGLEFKEMQDKITGAISLFNGLPWEIRSYFENTPEKLLKFMEDPKNRKEAEKLGIINPEWTEETDGLGEHVKEGEQKTKKAEREEADKQEKINTLQKELEESKKPVQKE